MFSDGREVKSYQIGELVSDAEIIPHTMPHIFWLSGNRLDEESGAWLIASASGGYFKVDVSTGEILWSIFYPHGCSASAHL